MSIEQEAQKYALTQKLNKTSHLMGFITGANWQKQQQDDFAIGFAEWVNVNAYKYPTKTTTKELLEIYKKTL